MNGSQFSSSVGGIRSGLVNTPADKLRLISFQGRNLAPQHTDCSITARIVLFSQYMSTLVNKVGYISSSELEGYRIFNAGRTFAGNGKQDYATWFLDVGYCQSSYQPHLSILTTPDKETYGGS